MEEKKKVHTKHVFEGLVFSESDGEPLETTFIGEEAHYVMIEDGFRRHIEAEYIDRQIVSWLQKQFSANKDIVLAEVMERMGKDDLFTKAMLDSSLNNMDRILEVGVNPDSLMMLGMMGIRFVVDFHGDVVKFDLPAHELP